MEVNEILILGMFGTFLVLLFIGIPVAWVLSGVGVGFAFLGYYSDLYFDTWTGLDFTTLGWWLTVSTKSWTTGYWLRCPCSFLWEICWINPGSQTA